MMSPASKTSHPELPQLPPPTCNQRNGNAAIPHDQRTVNAASTRRLQEQSVICCLQLLGGGESQNRHGWVSAWHVLIAGNI